MDAEISASREKIPTFPAIRGLRELRASGVPTDLQQLPHSARDHRQNHDDDPLLPAKGRQAQDVGERRDQQGGQLQSQGQQNGGNGRGIGAAVTPLRGARLASSAASITPRVRVSTPSTASEPRATSTSAVHTRTTVMSPEVNVLVLSVHTTVVEPKASTAGRG
jgi:hypothetical protein